MTTIATKEDKTVPSLFTDFFGRDFFNDDFFNVSAPLVRSVPAANVKETDKDFRVEVSAPGYEKKNFSVRMEEDVLVIEAKKEEEKKEENERFTRREFRTASFMRSFRVPQNVDGEKVDAVYENGILKIVLHKKEDKKSTSAKEINVL